MFTYCTRLKQVRSHFRLTQDEMAQKLEISKYTYFNYEAGKVIPRIDLLDALKNVFNVNANWFLSGEGPMFQTILLPDSLASDPMIKEFLFWFEKYPIVQIEAIASLEDLKIKHKKLFVKETKNEKA